MAVEVIQSDPGGPVNQADRDRFLADASARAPGQEVDLPVRELLGMWGAQRRGYWYVQQVKAALDDHNLVSVPPFDEGWIDNVVRLVPADRVAQSVAPHEPTEEAPAPTEAEERARRSQWRAPESQETVSVTMAGSLALGDLLHPDRHMARVSPNDTLETAQSLMLRHNCQFLPVMTGERSLSGVVTWESIAKGVMHNATARLKDCISPANILDAGADLTENIPLIIQSGCVFVRIRDKSIGGMITVGDLAEAFERLAVPFLRIGVAERLLRDVVEAHFSVEEIRAVVQGRERDPSHPAEDATFGELMRLFDSEERWHRLNWRIDRKVFRGHLDDVRVFRNDLMHFRSEEVSQERVDDVKQLISWLRLIAS
jgi:CBS domain-containing protein